MHGTSDISDVQHEGLLSETRLVILNVALMTFLLVCSWVTLNRQATAVAGGISPGGDLGSNYVTNVFDIAKNNGFNTVRIFGHGEETSFELQTEPGATYRLFWVHPSPNQSVLPSR